MMISNKRGFTLIELLVVVLIIGVLAAVALPQYQTAINKSRYAGLMPLARSVKDAEEEIFMTKADYTADLGDLAVAPGNIDENNTSTATQGNVTLSVVAGASEGQDYVKAVDNRNADNTFIMYFARSPKYAGEIHCEAKTNNAKAQQLCKSYGPVGTVTNGADTTGTFTTYVLQGTGEDAEQSGGGGGTSGGGSGTCESGTCWGNTDMDQSTYDLLASAWAAGEWGSGSLADWWAAQNPEDQQVDSASLSVGSGKTATTLSLDRFVEKGTEILTAYYTADEHNRCVSYNHGASWDCRVEE